MAAEEAVSSLTFLLIWRPMRLSGLLQAMRDSNAAGESRAVTAAIEAKLVTLTQAREALASGLPVAAHTMVSALIASGSMESAELYVLRGQACRHSRRALRARRVGGGVAVRPG